MAQVMVSLGNTVMNSIYETKVDTASDLSKPQPDSIQPIRDAWIQAKYVKKLFVDHRWDGDETLGKDAVIIPESGILLLDIVFDILKIQFYFLFFYFLGQVDPNWLLCKGAETGHIVWIARALALYGDRNFPSNDRGRAPIHLAVLNVPQIVFFFFYI